MLKKYKKKFTHLFQILILCLCDCRFRVISSSIYTEADGVLMMFSFDSLPSLQNCRATWFKQWYASLVIVV